MIKQYQIAGNNFEHGLVTVRFENKVTTGNLDPLNAHCAQPCASMSFFCDSDRTRTAATTSRKSDKIG